MSMRIAFISPRPFGQFGTPGTYKLVERVVEHHSVRVFARPPSEGSVYDARIMPLIPFIGKSRYHAVESILPALLAFDPHVVYLFNGPTWPETLAYLKAAFPTAKYVLDIKTPLLAVDDDRHRIQKQGRAAQAKLDALVTHCAESVFSWIPSCTIQPLELPPGVDLSYFFPAEERGGSQHIRHYVYAASLHPLRKAEQIIDGFAAFSRDAARQPTLDIFGDGPDREPLADRIAAHGLQETIRLRGLVKQEDLLPMLSEYDASIAWVPRDPYDDSPSLKALEYMAAGLPVLATATSAHRRLAEQGFTLDYCDDDPESLAKGMQRLSEQGFGSERVRQNLAAVKAFDYDTLISNRLLPFLDRLVRSGPATVGADSATVRERCTATVPMVRDALVDRQAHGYKRDRLKLLFVCNSVSAKGKGGADRVALNTAAEMARRGHLVYMAYSNTGKPSYTPSTRVILLPYTDLNTLKTQVKGIDPDVFFVFYFNNQVMGFYRLVGEFGMPFAMQECTNPRRLCTETWDQSKCGGLHAAWEREVVASAATRIRLTMPGYADSLPEYVRPQVRAYPNPAYPDGVLADPAGTPDRRKTILCINGFKANKNLITLLRAFARLAPAFPDWDLKVVGSEPEWKATHEREIAAFIKANGLRERVLISGPTDDIQREYAAAHIHVIASLSEGCPTVVLEAMAVGLPSVGFENCPGTNELIRHDISGLLAEAGDRVTGMETALRRLMANPELRQRFGDQAAADAWSYNPQSIYDQWEQMLYEAASYKGDVDRLFREQAAIDPERAMHARRMRSRLIAV